MESELALARVASIAHERRPRRRHSRCPGSDRRRRPGRARGRRRPFDPPDLGDPPRPGS